MLAGKSNSLVSRPPRAELVSNTRPRAVRVKSLILQGTGSMCGQFPPALGHTSATGLSSPACNPLKILRSKTVKGLNGVESQTRRFGADRTLIVDTLAVNLQQRQCSPYSMSVWTDAPEPNPLNPARAALFPSAHLRPTGMVGGRYSPLLQVYGLATTQ